MCTHFILSNLRLNSLNLASIAFLFATKHTLTQDILEYNLPFFEKKLEYNKRYGMI